MLHTQFAIHHAPYTIYNSVHFSISYMIYHTHHYAPFTTPIIQVIHAFLRSCVAPAQRMIHDLIQIELAYINTSHPDFVGGKAAVTAAQQAQQVKLNKPAEGGAMPPPTPSVLSSPPPAA
ncbi:hypothetical protein EON63_16725, partial [archaeon]